MAIIKTNLNSKTKIAQIKEVDMKNPPLYTLNSLLNNPRVE